MAAYRGLGQALSRAAFSLCSAASTSAAPAALTQLGLRAAAAASGGSLAPSAAAGLQQLVRVSRQ